MLAFVNTVYEHLLKIDQVDISTSALYRLLAYGILSTPKIDLATRQKIADLLNQANWQLAMESVDPEDSY